MNENVGASIALSFLIVGVVAVVLYRPEALPPRPAAAEPIEVVATAEPETNDPLPPPTSTVPSPAPDGPAREPARQRILAASPDPLPEAPTPAAPPARPISRRAAEVTPGFHPTFTTTSEGETLADVARRVYGSAAATQDLWLANRDHVARIDAPLPAGTLLRTP